MAARALACLFVSLVLCACDTGTTSTDAGTGMDAARPDGASGDSGRPVDGNGIDPGDAGPAAMACNPLTGIECDGDWEGRCPTACSDTECCSPNFEPNGGQVFHCVPRGPSGCPAADIWVDTSRIEGQYFFETRTFRTTGPSACAIAEGCVDAAGDRRLLKFDTWTPNTGTADLYLGDPTARPELFQYSPCHMHYHFNSYARYTLLDAATGAVAARGHKQAFCLLDFFQYPGTSTAGRHYTCGDQGIQEGYQDVYDSQLDCQWVDVTDVAPGNYILRIEVNYEGVLNESDYTNNVAEVQIVVPPP